MGRRATVWRWLNERVPVEKLLHVGLDEEIPGGASFMYTLGSAVLFIILIQVATGVWQLFYYVPTVDHAYDSLQYLVKEVPFGWLLHGLHYWGASAMVVLVALHMLQVVVWGAYKRPREMVWFFGVLLLLLSMLMSFTGAPLPWDQRGFWAGEVGTEMIGTVPLVGGWLLALVRGGSSMGQLTLSRFFVMHVALIPAALVGMVVLHLIAFRTAGSAGPWSEERGAARRGLFWPDQVTKDLILAGIVLALLVGLSIFSPPPTSGPADPTDSSFVPKPEWNFLFLYQALKFFPGALEPLGTVGIPLVLVLFLFSLPFIDRRPDRDPRRRPLVLTLMMALIVVTVTLTVVGVESGPASARHAGAGPPVASASHLSSEARAGAKLFVSLGCHGCHAIHGTGGVVGPDLSNERGRGRTVAWLTQQIQDPTSHFPTGVMPSFASLDSAKVHALVAFLLSQSVDSSAAGAPPIRSND
ncbi:MAG: cytochrome b N-terminal domain-containing protein [Gemmatimonadales bacterium]